MTERIKNNGFGGIRKEWQVFGVGGLYNADKDASGPAVVDPRAVLSVLAKARTGMRFMTSGQT